MAVKRIQNRVAESRLILPVTALLGGVLWLLCGLIQHGWWIQFVCYGLSTFIMMELNRSHALIRIYSRSVAVSFIVLTGVTCYLFPSLEAGITMLCLTASLLTLYKTFQDKAAVGWVFYTFLLLGLITLMKVHAFWLVPVYWLVMVFCLGSLGWRTFLGSLLGLILPYFYLAAIVFYRFKGDFKPFTDHFLPLTDFQFPYHYTQIPLQHILTYAFLLILSLTGIIHFLRTSYNDRLRIRLFYYSFMLIVLTMFVLIALQPQHFELFVQMAIIMTSPLIAHFIALTHTRITNIAFLVIVITAVALIGFHVWISSFTS